VALLAAGCAAPADRSDDAGAAVAPDQAEGGAVEARDDAGRSVRLARPARRVLSLVPSGTEMVAALAGPERLVGRTRYDDDPALAALPTVGGGVDPSLEAIVALRPDLVLVWESEAQGTMRGQLTAAGIPTFALQSSDTADVFSAMARLGRLLGRDQAASELAARVRGQLDSVRLAVASRPTPTVLYVVGVTPAMTAGTATFVIELLGVAGGRSAFPDISDGWPTLSLEEIVSRDPDIVLLPVSDDPTVRVSTLQRTAGWRELRAVREGRIVTVSASLVNRPGPRMGEAAAALARAIHGDP
jgi:iron complex transport system substrate-binding protein